MPRLKFLTSGYNYTLSVKAIGKLFDHSHFGYFGYPYGVYSESLVEPQGPDVLTELLPVE